MHTHPYEHTHANFIPMSTSEILSRQILDIDEVTTGASLLTGTSSTTKKIAPVKSWNKSRKIRAPAGSSSRILIGTASSHAHGMLAVKSHHNRAISRSCKIKIRIFFLQDKSRYCM
uniref:Uncharacterized protein n=1 Tax=Setaria italica TaxID=4555 RepID=K3Y1N0_SETIT